jgi:hypothetical protein
MLIPLATAALVCAILIAGPGFVLLRRSGWEPEEVLAAAPGLSILVVGMARFALFAAGALEAAGWIITGACVLLAILPVRDALAAIAGPAATAAGPGAGPPAGGTSAPAAHRALAAAALVAGWVLSLTALIRNYGAGNWNTDWVEHFQRARFFLGWQPLDTTFVGAALPARPPLFNLFAAQVMTAAGGGYEVYQVTAVLVALLGFFPVLLLAREFAPRAARLPWAVAGFLMLSPMFVENAAYPWTKQTAAWMVIAATALYLRARRSGDAGRMVAAFALAAGGVLVHYSAGPYALFLGAHYLVATFRGRARRGRELAAIAGVAAVVIVPWLAWCAAVYGPAAAATTTSSWRDAGAYTGTSHAAKIILNIRDTIVPDFLRGVSSDARPTGMTWGRVREMAFMAYQSNLLLAPGILGVALLVIDLSRRRGTRGWPPPGRGFWGGFVLAGLVLGIAAHGARDRLGLAHLVLQPVVLAVTAYLAAAFVSWGPRLRTLAIGGLAFDLAFGIALHFWLQAYPLDLPAAWRGPLGLTGSDLFIGFTEANWILKRDGGLGFLGDRAAGVAPLLAFVAAAFAAGAFAALVSAARGERPR